MEARSLYHGLGKLRNSFICQAMASVISIAFYVAIRGSPPPIQETGLPALSPEVLTYLALLAILGLGLLLLLVISWIYKVLGWGDICKAGLKRFYCYTKLGVLFLPILGIMFMLVTSLVAGLRALSSPTEPVGLSAWSWVSNLGLALISSGLVFDGVSLLDFYHREREAPLGIGCPLYLTYLLLTPLASRLPPLASLGLNVSELTGAVMIVVGLSRVRNKVSVNVKSCG